MIGGPKLREVATMRRMGPVAASLGAMALTLAGVVAIGPSAGCGAVCRDIETTDVEIVCQTPPQFTGEAHFDSAATFETFLSQQCLYDASQETVDAIVDSVDFNEQAVFVAVGPAAIDNTRCVSSRTLDKAQVCSDGLKVYFLDEYATVNGTCAAPRWTVAFSLDRDDLRAALDAAEASE